MDVLFAIGLVPQQLEGEVHPVAVRDLRRKGNGHITGVRIIRNVLRVAVIHGNATNGLALPQIAHHHEEAPLQVGRSRGHLLAERAGLRGIQIT